MVKNYLKIVSIDEYSVTPKYQQIVNSIQKGIEAGIIEKNAILPSINDLSIAFDLSRNTIERAYNELKRMGIVQSIAGKGYFIANTDFNKPIKVLLLFNKLSTHKKIIYDAFASTLGPKAAIDFYIYNNDFNFFKKLLADRIDQYGKLVIVPYFFENESKACEVINQIPKEKLVLMDKLVHGVTGQFAAVFEDFERDIYDALEQLLDRLSAYKTIKIIFPEFSYYPNEILTGFINFCTQYAFEYEIVASSVDEKIQAGTVYINLMEDDLVTLIEKTIAANFTIGKDVGIISYNETPLKKLILDGITTISTNFKAMGETAASLILEDERLHIANPFDVVKRNSV